MDNNMRVDIKKATQKWGSIIESITKEIKEQGLQNLTKEQKLALYAEYHTYNESMNYSTLEGVGMGSVKPNISMDVPPIYLNKTLLPTSLKILVGFSLNNDFSKVHIISSPKYTSSIDGEVQIGDIEFHDKIDMDVRHKDFEETANRIIFEKTLSFFNSIDPNKKIYIYLVVQNVSLVTEASSSSSILRWRSRIAIL